MNKYDYYHLNTLQIFGHMYLVPLVLVSQLVLEDGGDAGGGPGGVVLGGVGRDGPACHYRRERRPFNIEQYKNNANLVSNKLYQQNQSMLCPICEERCGV